ncbi:MAG TPA: hypothetical protein VN767_23930 [Streptosporangiaceae bacterium]|nr:hypothetical protein [Streptosporangiaceae bacterium]
MHRTISIDRPASSVVPVTVSRSWDNSQSGRTIRSIGARAGSAGYRSAAVDQTAQQNSPSLSTSLTRSLFSSSSSLSRASAEPARLSVSTDGWYR